MTTPREHACPRRLESALHRQCPGADHYLADGTCSYCGSISEDAFMERLRAGDIEVTPTDKNYKVYVKNKGGAPFLREVGERREHPTSGEVTTVPTLKETETATFYLQHLTVEQRHEFIAKHNDNSMHIGFPGRFYVWPFFMRPA